MQYGTTTDHVKQQNGNNVFFQPKYAINTPGDIYEQEADAVAEQVVQPKQIDNTHAFFKPLIISPVQRKCADCEEEEKLQRKDKDGTETETTGAFENYVDGLNNSGASLSADNRSFFESRIGHDFSNVKIHTDAVAAKSAQSINALAYTTGNHIVFNENQYQPETTSGKKLLAHELTHVVQQNTTINRKLIQREFSIAPTVASPTFNTLTSTQIQTAIDFNSLTVTDATDIAELRDVLGVSRSPAAVDADFVYAIARYQAQYGLSQDGMIGSNTARLLYRELRAESAYLSDSKPDLVASRDRMQMRADIFAGSSFLTPTQHANVETVLNPGATVTTGSGGAVTVTLPTPSADCASGTWRTNVRNAVIPLIHSRASAFNTLQASPPTFPIAQANSMADLAQRETEVYFRPYLSAATRTPTDPYHIGGYSLRTQLRDQSTTTQWRSQSGRRGWTQYWMNTDARAIVDAAHCDQTTFETVRNEIADDTTLQADIDAAINGWPAEATGGVHIQPYLDASILRSQRWDTFTTLIHEFIHVLAHPNYRTSYQQLNAGAQEILKEGVTDVLRRELWDGAGNLFNRAQQSAWAANRVIVEGSSYTLDTTQMTYHGDYAQITDARQIETEVGARNLRLAYFLGHTELIGLGAGTTVNSGRSLSNIGMYHPDDLTNNEIVTVNSGETYAQLVSRTNARTVKDTSGTVLTAASALPSRVIVPGIRHVIVIANDTIETVAQQNGVSQSELRRANNLSSGATLSAGTRLIIPIH